MQLWWPLVPATAQSRSELVRCSVRMDQAVAIVSCSYIELRA